MKYQIFRAVLFFVMLAAMTSCSVKETCTSNDFSLVYGSGPKRIYVPKYYHYRNGKYEFVKGHYRTVLSPKRYAERSVGSESVLQRLRARFR